LGFSRDAQKRELTVVKVRSQSRHFTYNEISDITEFPDVGGYALSCEV
jgi:hypothetical protein